MKIVKKFCMLIMISAFLFSGTLIAQAASINTMSTIKNTTPVAMLSYDLNLPTVPVTMTVYDNGVISYFDTYLSNVPPGYDVTNGGPYLGWCCQTAAGIPRGVGHQVMLYSSYDPAMPASFMTVNWYKINYILNHKIGSEMEISIALWYFSGDWPWGMPPNSQMMVNNANLNGETFIPVPGEVIAILADGGSTIQRTFFELIVPPENGDYEGLTPGFWKNHLDAWDTYTPSQTLGSVFTAGVWYFPGMFSLQMALRFHGGPFLPGATRILLRSAVAALLNAAHPLVNYPMTQAEIISQVNSALTSMNRDTILDLATTLDTYNNLGCEDL